MGQDGTRNCNFQQLLLPPMLRKEGVADTQTIRTHGLIARNVTMADVATCALLHPVTLLFFLKPFRRDVTKSSLVPKEVKQIV